MVGLYRGALPVQKIITEWYSMNKSKNYGAFVNFVGIVRDEDGIDGLSYDVYDPILNEWFNGWKKRAADKGAIVTMAHSVGDVMVHESSYVAAIFSPKRTIALSMITDFVEDFKATAPIWKYDLIDGKRVYASDRSTKLANSGLLKA
jgi:molybdopterin synthase catalytic subunit